MYTVRRPQYFISVLVVGLVMLGVAQTITDFICFSCLPDGHSDVLNAHRFEARPTLTFILTFTLTFTLTCTLTFTLTFCPYPLTSTLGAGFASRSHRSCLASKATLRSR